MPTLRDKVKEIFDTQLTEFEPFINNYDFRGGGAFASREPGFNRVLEEYIAGCEGSKIRADMLADELARHCLEKAVQNSEVPISVIESLRNQYFDYSTE